MTYKPTVKCVAVNRKSFKESSLLKIHKIHKILDENDIKWIKNNLTEVSKNILDDISPDDDVYLTFNLWCSFVNIFNRNASGSYDKNRIDIPYASWRVYDTKDFLFEINNSIDKNKLIWEDLIIGGEGNSVLTDDDAEAIIDMFGSRETANVACTMLNNCDYKKSIVQIIKILHKRYSDIYDYRKKLDTLTKYFDIRLSTYDFHIETACSMLEKVNEYTKCNFIKVAKIYNEDMIFSGHTKMIYTSSNWEFKDDPPTPAPEEKHEEKHEEKPEEPEAPKPIDIEVETVGYDLFGQPIIKATTKPKAQREEHRW